jgi:hypothetical protein
VPVWRSSALEAVLQASLDEDGLTEAAVTRLVDVGAPEGEQLDFKLNPHLSESGVTSKGSDKGWSAGQEFAKDICAFANHLGGVIFVGVKDENDVAVEARPTVIDPGAVEQRMRQALLNFATPPPRFQVVAIGAAAGGHYLALIIPPSPSAPHAVRGPASNARRPLHFPVRDGADTRWLLEHEVADRYRSRFGGRERLDVLQTETVGAGLEALARSDDDLWLYLAIVPESPAMQRLDRPTVAAMTQWWRNYGLVSPLGRDLPRNGTPTPAPGRITVSGQDAIFGEDTDPRGMYVELYVDGRAFAAAPINTNTGGVDRFAVGERTLADDTVLLTDAIVSWACHQAGTWGTAEVMIGLAYRGLGTGAFPAHVTLNSNDTGELRKIRGTRALPGPIQARTTADLDDAQQLLGRLRVCRDALTVLLHHFGIAETRQFETDGTIVTWAWGGDSNARVIERWARDNDLPFQNRDHASWK